MVKNVLFTVNRHTAYLAQDTKWKKKRTWWPTPIWLRYQVKKKKSFGILQNPQEKKNIRNLLITKERLPFIWKVFISKEKE